MTRKKLKRHDTQNVQYMPPHDIMLQNALKDNSIQKFKLFEGLVNRKWEREGLL